MMCFQHLTFSHGTIPLILNVSERIKPLSVASRKQNPKYNKIQTTTGHEFAQKDDSRFSSQVCLWMMMVLLVETEHNQVGFICLCFSLAQQRHILLSYLSITLKKGDPKRIQHAYRRKGITPKETQPRQLSSHQKSQ
jgi:hypothetical protein